MKSIPMGIQDFKEIRDSDLYLVDKSRLISDVLENSGTKVFLFTRPRRFGKSLNLSMLDAYLNSAYSGNTWFDDLSISDIRPRDPEKNSNTVILLDMKNFGNGEYGKFIINVRNRMTELYVKALKPENSEEILDNPKLLFPDVETDEGIVGLSDSLLALTRKLHFRDGRKVIVLIDEYDNPMNGAKNDENRRLILDFIKEFLGKALKGNEYLKFAVVTGVMRIAKESIFSGLNNLLSDSVLDTKFGEAFGFTSAEVEKLCADYGHPEAYENAREWYDGYRFGSAEMYNPWSLLNYVYRDFVPGAYWAGTSGNDIIDRMIESGDASVYTDFRLMAKGDAVVSKLNDSAVYADLDGKSEAGNLYSVMTASGYLCAVPHGEQFAVSIPNKEMFIVFEEKFTERLGNSGRRIDNLRRAVLSGNSEEVSKSLSEFATKINPKVMSHEHSYEILTIALLMNLEGPYTVENEVHAGKGYCDIRMRSNRSNLPHVVIELKRGPEEDIDNLSQSALAQIHEKKYDSDLNGTVLLYGIAFSDSAVSVTEERIVR